ncbi:hypothetical protein [Acidianus manzaensis]|uniref:Uncharacterized protein n=1 Tax=Acidianus manzaensis TaxID=282676 RepID=A0A1W6JWZ7_9CREN|nr:hypothetical protein [Acidianus manzaensis]ARM74750.1 hypothetical protein B6F84_01060 [Acidianus manzaensis]
MSWFLENVNCVIGEYGISKVRNEVIKELKDGKRKNKGEVTANLSLRNLRVIDSNFINSFSDLRVKDILNIYNKTFGSGKNVDFWLNFFSLPLEEIKGNLSEFNKFKLEIMKIFFGDTKVVLSENFLENIEEQMKDKALKLLLKSVRYTKSKLLIFMSSTEYLSICDIIYLIYGDVIEVSRRKSLIHPYAEILGSVLTVGKGRLNVREIGPPNKVGCGYHDYCPYVMQICRVRKPELMNGVACFKYNKEISIV